MEVHRATGTPFSVLQVKARPSFPVLKVGLTLPRDVLYRRVDQRVDAMMAAGLLDEVRRLHGAGYGWELPSMSGLGYRQLGEYLRGERTLEDAVQRIKFDTHAYVRRQYTWFRKDPATVWYGAVDLPNVAAQVLAAVRSASGTNEN
jgi:tRNA dimethylallyltransferase